MTDMIFFTLDQVPVKICMGVSKYDCSVPVCDMGGMVCVSSAKRRDDFRLFLQ